MDGRFSVAVTSVWLDTLQFRELWLTLVTASPFTVSDPRFVEVPGIGYTRQLQPWERTSPTLLTMSDAAVWGNLLPGTVVAGVAGFDAEVNGVFLFADMLPVPKTIGAAEGGSFTLAAGDLVLGIDL